jgi:hypothetical protein
MASNLGFDCFVPHDATACHDRTTFEGKVIPADTVAEVALASLHGEFATVCRTSDICDGSIVPLKAGGDNFPLSLQPLLLTTPATISAAAPKITSVAEYNQQNRNAPSAATSLARGTGNSALPKKRPLKRSDGTFKCCRNGCREVYSSSDNVEGSCSYHSGTPVFGGNEKYWSCCPENGKFWEYDKFEGIKKCCVGKHVDEVENYDTVLREKEGGETVAGNIHASMGYDGTSRVVADYVP